MKILDLIITTPAKPKKPKMNTVLGSFALQLILRKLI